MEEQTNVVEMESLEEVVTPPRLTIIFHPNRSYADVVLNDRMFNRERYTSSREKEPEGTEKILLDYLNDFIVGINRANASKNTLRLEMQEGVLPREFIPQVITAVKEWGSASEPYSPEIYVDNRRYAVDPIYDEDGYMKFPGVKEKVDALNIGIPYKLWGDLR